MGVGVVGLLIVGHGGGHSSKEEVVPSYVVLVFFVLSKFLGKSKAWGGFASAPGIDVGENEVAKFGLRLFVVEPQEQFGAFR